ncbi:MAG TPA: response regulator [Dyella sp.]|uniref:response regulator n=1 Tax=Dyella sp. TaxID=1869338 RepID=UPI002F9582A0
MTGHIATPFIASLLTHPLLPWISTALEYLVVAALAWSASRLFMCREREPYPDRPLLAASSGHELSSTNGNLPDEADDTLPVLVEAVPLIGVSNPGYDTSVLLIEGHRSTSVAIEGLLSSLGYRVTAAARGGQALEILRDRVFDLILLDCNLPDTNGYALTQRIRDQQPGRHTPILAVSSHRHPAHKMACMDCGMDGVLTKPLRATVLQAEFGLWRGYDPTAPNVVAPSDVSMD